MTEQLEKKVRQAIKLISSASKIAKENGFPEIEVAYSGGKDSDVILELTKMAGVPYRAIYKNTTIDPPGTTKHAKDNGCEIIQPKHTFIEMLENKGFPSRFKRFCCAELKEYKILDYAILGIRRDESIKRVEIYKEPELCRVYNKKEKVRQYFPILEWTKEDVAEFVKERKIQCHRLYYDENGGFHPERRLGCMCCPLANRPHRLDTFKKYPNMVKLYLRGGKKYIKKRNERGKYLFKFRDEYELFVMNVFCDGLEDFNNKFRRKGMLFDDGIDCKKYLEDFFKIKL